MKVNVLEAFSQHCGFHLFHGDLSAPAMTTDMSQVGTALFRSFKNIFIISPLQFFLLC